MNFTKRRLWNEIIRKSDNCIGVIQHEGKTVLIRDEDNIFISEPPLKHISNGILSMVPRGNRIRRRYKGTYLFGRCVSPVKPSISSKVHRLAMKKVLLSVKK